MDPAPRLMPSAIIGAVCAAVGIPCIGIPCLTAPCTKAINSVHKINLDPEYDTAITVVRPVLIAAAALVLLAGCYRWRCGAAGAGRAALLLLVGYAVLKFALPLERLGVLGAENMMPFPQDAREAALATVVLVAIIAAFCCGVSARAQALRSRGGCFFLCGGVLLAGMVLPNAALALALLGGVAHVSRRAAHRPRLPVQPPAAGARGCAGGAGVHRTGHARGVLSAAPLRRHGRRLDQPSGSRDGFENDCAVYVTWVEYASQFSQISRVLRKVGVLVR